jgi:hypothetical protein
MVDGDQDFHPVTCPGCQHVFFATPAQFPTIEARQNLCPDCFRLKIIEDLGLGALFRPGGLLYGS